MSAGAGGGLPPRGVPAGCGAPAACAPAPRPRPPAGAGAGPSGTIRALVMVALSNLTLVRFSQGVAAAAAPRSTRAMLLIIGGPFGQTPSIHRLAAALAKDLEYRRHFIRQHRRLGGDRRFVIGADEG